ncbi:hypothetical protein GQ457_11G030650 [Hibiscus cannabinus]
MRFGRKGKLSPRYIGPYEIVGRVGPVAYRLLLPLELERIHDVFLVSMLRKYRSDPSHVMPVEEIELNPDLSYDEEPIEILASDSKVLRGKTIELIRTLETNHWSLLKEVFVDVEYWSDSFKIPERTTWREVVGFPLHCSNPTTFKRIDATW